MRIMKSSVPSEQHITAKRIIEMLNYNEINDDIDIQRGYVWDDKKSNNRKSLFIYSLLMGKIVPPLYFNKIDGVYDLIDGKQRLTTLCEFVNNNFKLIGLPEVPIENKLPV